MIEILIYILLIVLLNTQRRIYSGMKNGAFYGKNAKPLPERLEDYIKNIHLIESPAWYAQFGAVFFAIFAIFRLITPEFDWNILWSGINAMLITMGSSGMASYGFQKWVNHGSGLPDFNPNEDARTEFTFKNPFTGKIYSKWLNIKGRDSKSKIYIGVISVITGLTLEYFINIL